MSTIDVIETVHGAIESQWLNAHAKPPRILYHYTSAAGLLGILETQRLWASHTRYLNDPSELDYGAALVQSIVETFRSEKDVTAAEMQMLSDVASPFARYEASDIDAYVFCFCAKPDVLSQWRAYGQKGGGYALGLRTNEMRFSRDRGVLFRLFRIEYREAVQRKLITSAIHQILAITRAVAERDEQQKALDHASLCLRAILANYCITFKSPAFREEREWRALYLTSTRGLEQRFRPSEKLIVPYVELVPGPAVAPKDRCLPLAVIRYGPTLQPELTERSLRLITRKYGFEGVRVEASGVPLRET